LKIDGWIDGWMDESKRPKPKTKTDQKRKADGVKAEEKRAIRSKGKHLST
jgi:hypothetical protein